MEQCVAEWKIEGPVHYRWQNVNVKPGVLQEVTSSCFKHIDKPVHRHIPFTMEQCAAEWRKIDGLVHLQMVKRNCVLNQECYKK